jgi:hypothetical protein
LNTPSAKEFLSIDLIGKDPELFQRLFSRLNAAIENALSSLSKNDLSAETKHTVQDITTVLKDFVEAKISRPSIENQKILSEIANQYAQVEERLANARRANAEANSLEIDNATKKLQSCLQIIKLLHEIGSLHDSNSHSILLQ